MLSAWLGYSDGVADQEIGVPGGGLIFLLSKALPYNVKFGQCLRRNLEWLEHLTTRKQA
jgi:hypothetical protein